MSKKTTALLHTVNQRTFIQYLPMSAKLSRLFQNSTENWYIFRQQRFFNIWANKMLPLLDISGPKHIHTYIWGRSQFTFTDFSTFLTTHPPPIYIRLHFVNHPPTVNVYNWNLTTPSQYVPRFSHLNLLALTITTALDISGNDKF